MRYVVRFKDRVFNNYYFDPDFNIIYQYTQEEKELSHNNRTMHPLVSTNPKPAQLQYDPIPHVILDNNRYRLDYVVAYTVYGKPEGILRLIHIDGNMMNCDWMNLDWLLSSDVMEKYRKLYAVDNLYDIPEEWRVYKLPYRDESIEVSNTGALRKLNGELIYLSIDTGGYRVYKYYGDDKKTHTLFAHRAVAESFVDNPNPEQYDVVNHLDGNKENNYFWNLEWCTTSMNMNHAQVTGLRGDHIKVDEALVHEICKALEKGIAPKEIEKEFGVSKKYISKIYTRTRWASISANYTFPSKSFTMEDKSRISILIKEGLKGAEIADRMGMVYDTKFISLYERLKRKQNQEG